MVGLVFGIWLFLFLRKTNARWRAGMDELQARTGWIIEDIHFSKFGKPASFRVLDPGGQWMVQSIVQTETQGIRGYQIQLTTPHPSGSGGMALLGPPMPQVDLGFMSSMMGGLVMPFLAKVAGLPAEDMDGMAAVQTSTPVTLISTPGAENWIDPGSLSSIFESWKHRYPSEQLHPIVIIGGGELRVRVRARFVEPRELESFTLMALAIRSAIITP